MRISDWSSDVCSSDLHDAQASLEVIQPDKLVTVDVKPASDAMLDALLAGQVQFRDAQHRDFLLGNIKARQRMIAQYAVAGAHRGLEIGRQSGRGSVVQDV